MNEYASESEGIIGTARWITALSCLPYGDTFASGGSSSRFVETTPSSQLTFSLQRAGSWDGSIRLWSIDSQLRSITPVTTIPALGFVNSLQLILPSLPSPSSSTALTNGSGKDMKKKSSDVKKEKTLVVVAGVAKEPRLGRWMRLKEGREGAVVVLVKVGEGARTEEE